MPLKALSRRVVDPRFAPLDRVAGAVSRFSPTRRSRLGSRWASVPAALLVGLGVGWAVFHYLDGRA